MQLHTFFSAHGRIGHVYEGRYKAVLVEKESYLLELLSYGVLNPVRAGMVKKTLIIGLGVVIHRWLGKAVAPNGCKRTGF